MTTSDTQPLSRREQRRAHRRQRPLWLRLLLATLQLMLILSLVVVIAGVAAYRHYSQDLPSVELLGSHRPFETTRLYARDGTTVLYEIFDPQVGQRTVIPFEDLPNHLKQATIAIEDANFYTNPGVNITSIARAAWANATNQPEGQGGASTITQQLVRNVLFAPEERNERTIRRKVREAILAYRISEHYSKDQILWLYLNEIPYGNNAYGIEAAAQAYFGLSARELSLPQAALLAGLPQAPSRLDPLTNPEAAKERQRQVLNAMVRHGMISQTEALAAWETPLSVKSARVDLQAPHFVFYVRSLLEARYGNERLYRGGLRVITTLDPHWQDVAQQKVEQRISEIRDQNATNGAVVMLDPQTNQVLAMVGSVDYNDAAIDGNVNVALAERQPGSTLKPFVYATTMMQGWTAATVLWDVPTEYALAGGEIYAPQNYDRAFHGPVSMRTALANSFNIPALKALEYVGIDRFLQQLHAMGISTLNDRPRYGLSLALGGGEVKLLDLTAAYSVFANKGMYRPPTSILRVENTRGEVLETWNEVEPVQVLGANGAGIAYLISNILSDNSAREWMFGSENALELSDNRPAAVKTGTTDDDRDSWAVGYTPQVVVGVWVGNSDNSPMQAVPGSFGAAVIWQRIMEAYHQDLPPTPFERPATIIDHDVCVLSGKNPTPACPQVASELFIEGTQPQTPDTMFSRVRVGPSGDCVAFNGQAGEERIFALYPPEAGTWRGNYSEPPTRPCIPARVEAANLPVVVTSPASNAAVGSTVRIEGSADQRYRLSWGAGSAPTRWETIVEGIGGIRNGLLGIWKHDEPEGVYTIRLEVDYAAGTVEELRTVNVDRTPPQVLLSVPTKGVVDQPLQLSALPEDNTTIARVEWKINQQTLVSTTIPWSVSWTPKLAGTYTVQAIAYDTAGNSNLSRQATITIQP